MRRNEKGISLIALIITIIVIIILAAIVIGGVFKTPNDAKFANFCQEYDRVQTAIKLKYYDLYQKYAIAPSTEVPTHYEIYNEIATGTAADSLTGESNIDEDSWVTILDTQWGTSKDKICSKPSGLTNNWYIRLNDGKLAYAGFEKGEKDMYYTPLAHTTGNRTAQAVTYFNGLTSESAADGETQSGLGTLLLNGLAASSSGSGSGSGSSTSTPVPLGENEAYLGDVVKVGDYVAYTPKTNGEYTPEPDKTGNSSTTKLTQTSGVKWRVWDIKNGVVRLISDEPTNYDASNGNPLILGTTVDSTETYTTDGSGAMYGAKAYANAANVMNKACNDIYGSTKAIKVENLTYKDIEEKVVSMPTITENHYVYYLNDTGYTANGTVTVTKSDNTTVTYTMKKANAILRNGITAPRFYTYDTDGITYHSSQSDSDSAVDYKMPTVVNNEVHPVYVTQTSSDGAPSWGTNTITGSHAGVTDYGQIFGSSTNSYWLASQCVSLEDAKVTRFRVRCVDSGSLSYSGLAYSNGNSSSYSSGLRPVVSLSSMLVVDTSTSTKNGSNATNAWILK